MDPRLIRLFEITGDTRALEMRRAHNMMLTGGDKCRLCGATTGLRNGLCKRHRKEARRNRGTCTVCGNACDDCKKYICDGCQHDPGDDPSPPASSSAASSAAAAKATTSAGASGSSSAARSTGSRCGICWGVGNLEQYDDNLWYHPACLIKWEADWTRVRGTSLPRRRIPRGYVPLSRLPPKHRLRFARKEAFIPMTFDEYKRVHMIRCKHLRVKCTEHHIQSDWTSHNDIYRQKVQGWSEDAPSKQHIRGPSSPPPLGVLREDVELRVEVASDGTRYAIYNPHFLLLDGKPLTDNQFYRMVSYIQQRKRPTSPQNPDAHLHMDGHPLMFQHIGGREENVTMDEVIGNPSNILASEIIAYMKRRRQHTPGSNSSGAGAASKSSSSSSSSSGTASAASKPPGSSAAASGRKRKEQSLPLSSPRIVQRRRVEEFEGDEDDPVIIIDDE